MPLCTLSLRLVRTARERHGAVPDGEDQGCRSAAAPALTDAAAAVVQVRISKHLQELEKMFYGSSMAYDKVRQQLECSYVDLEQQAKLVRWHAGLARA